MGGDQRLEHDGDLESNGYFMNTLFRQRQNIEIYNKKYKKD
jgi:hypothetical protein